jgi:hypothetical protein
LITEELQLSPQWKQETLSIIFAHLYLLAKVIKQVVLKYDICHVLIIFTKHKN